MNDKIYLKDLRVDCIIGIFDWERKRKQEVLIDLEFPCRASYAARTDAIEDTIDYKNISKAVLKFVQTSKFGLIESLAESVADIVLRVGKVSWVKVRLSKPGAIRYSQNVGLEITRYNQAPRIFISLGSNIKQESSVPQAVKLIKRRFDFIRASSIYKCRAHGTKKQPDFWNAVIEISADQTPSRLKAELRKIESELGRKRSKDKFSPRVIDLDIAYYGDKIVQTKILSIPPKEALKTDYILLPMAEIAPEFRHPITGRTMIECLADAYQPKRSFDNIGRI